MNSQKEDIDLVYRALKGQQLAFKKLYAKHQRSLFLVCLRYAKDKATAEDFLQEAFISIYKNLKKFDQSRGVFEAWAKRIVINTCLMHIRRNRLYAVNITGEEQIASQAPDILSQLSLQEMLQLIQQMPYGYKTIFNLYVIDGYSHNEIAAELGIAVGTSKSQLLKARNYLKKKLQANQQVFNSEHG
ncbi:MAG: sigma-70 family RNA polymerase sigma factor [Chitinophagales bacterium]|nr:sigma-70 family RNA polymerase sigma factor [Chitinophagales bacterium]